MGKGLVEWIEYDDGLDSNRFGGWKSNGKRQYHEPKRGLEADWKVLVILMQSAEEIWSGSTGHINMRRVEDREEDGYEGCDSVMMQ